MILGASYSQLPLYEAARKLGAATVAASTPGDWPGFAVADESVYADITNPEAILKAAQEKGIDGIATCCLDAGVRALGYTCEKMGLIGPSARAADISNDKFKMKEAFMAGGVQCARHICIHSLEELEEDYYRVNEMGELASFILGFHAEYTTSRDRMEGLAALANKVKSPVFLHNAETALEVKECKERWGMTPTGLTDALGMYTYGGGGYHCIHMEDGDFEIFKKRQLTAVTNPASNLKLASGIAPIKRYLDEGIALAIGTDGPASNNCLDMFREMFLTTALAKVKEQDAACVPAEEVLYMATAAGAQCMGLADCDSLSVGKKADIIMIDLMQPNMQPENDIAKNIVYSGSKQNVIMTMVNGRILYENGQFEIGFDPKEIYAKANAVIGRMK